MAVEAAGLAACTGFAGAVKDDTAFEDEGIDDGAAEAKLTDATFGAAAVLAAPV